MAMSNIAKVVQWNKDKGYGFAEVNNVKYFVHVTALGKTARLPQVGDTIVVSMFGKDEKGPRIEKGTLEGVDLIGNQVRIGRKFPSHMPNKNKNWRGFVIAVCIALAAFLGIQSQLSNRAHTAFTQETNASENFDGQYTSKMEVAEYICKNGHLPGNYVTKFEGKQLFEQKTGKSFSKWNFNPLTTLGVMIGGDEFSNREGLLPEGDWREADVDYFASNRGTNRLVYRSNCQIYYTGNHYKSFSKIEF